MMNQTKSGKVDLILYTYKLLDEKIIMPWPLDKLKKHTNALENIKYRSTKQTFLKLIV